MGNNLHSENLGFAMDVKVKNFPSYNYLYQFRSKKVVDEFLEAKISFLPPINLVDSAFRPRIGDSKLEKFSGQKDFNKAINFFLDQVNEGPTKLFLEGKRQDVFFSRLRSS